MDENGINHCSGVLLFSFVQNELRYDGGGFPIFSHMLSTEEGSNACNCMYFLVTGSISISKCIYRGRTCGVKLI